MVLHKDYFAAVYLSGAAVGLRDMNVFQELVLPLPTAEVETGMNEINVAPCIDIICLLCV